MRVYLFSGVGEWCGGLRDEGDALARARRRRARRARAGERERGETPGSPFFFPKHTHNTPGLATLIRFLTRASSFVAAVPARSCPILPDVSFNRQINQAEATSVTQTRGGEAFTSSCVASDHEIRIESQGKISLLDSTRSGSSHHRARVTLNPCREKTQT